MTDRELMQQALGYMESVGQMDMHPEEWAIAVSLRERLAQPEQEPVAWMNPSTPAGVFARHKMGAENFGCTVPLYTAPPRCEWVGLTDDELNMIGDSMRTWNSHSLTDVYIAIEAKLKEKNA